MIPEKSAIRGIIFDMGDILYDASIWRKWLCGKLNEHSIVVDYTGFIQKWEELLIDVYEGKANYWNRFTDLLDYYGLPKREQEKLIPLAKQKALDVQKERRLFEGVQDTLKTLKTKAKLAVLSDNESGELKVRSILNDLDIEDYFASVVTSADIGFAKPNPEAYKITAGKLGLLLENCAFVGHDVDELEGAIDAGLFAIAYNAENDVPAHKKIEHFSELLNLVV